MEEYPPLIQKVRHSIELKKKLNLFQKFDITVNRERPEVNILNPNYQLESVFSEIFYYC